MFSRPESPISITHWMQFQGNEPLQRTFTRTPTKFRSFGRDPSHPSAWSRVYEKECIILDVDMRQDEALVRPERTNVIRILPGFNLPFASIMVQGFTVWNDDACIVLGIGIGATQSAVAFSHLYKSYSNPVLCCARFANVLSRWSSVCPTGQWMARPRQPTRNSQDSDPNIL